LRIKGGGDISSPAAKKLCPPEYIDLMEMNTGPLMLIHLSGTEYYSMPATTPYGRSSHPLDLAISPEDANRIKELCNEKPSSRLYE
jgi:hypothetical protein